MPQTSDYTREKKTNFGSLTLTRDKVPISVSTSAVKPIQTTTIQPSVVKMTDLTFSKLQINDVRFINPDLSKSVASIPFLPKGVPRNKIVSPVSNAIEVTDQILFEEAVDATKKLYLPRWRIATHTISGQLQYRVSLTGSGEGGILTLYLEKYPAEQLGTSVRGAKELPHEVAVILKYVLANSGGIQKELIFQELIQEDNLLRAVLHVNTLPEKDELFYALTIREYRTDVIVRRTAKVAVPVAPLHKAARVNPGIVGEPLFRETTRVLDNSIPLYFDRDIHRYIFSNLPSSTGSELGMKPWTVKWKNLDHNYYQEVSRPEIFYYLPDAFKLVRRPESPHAPVMAITIESSDVSAELAQVTLEYGAFKFEDMNRLGDAAKKLRDLLHLSPEKQLIFMPLGADSDKIIFTLKLPRVAGVSETRTNANVSTRLGFTDSLTLPMNDFLSMWDALAGTGSPVLFQGQVEIDLAVGKEQIPFVAQLNNMVGSFMDYTGEYDIGSGMLKARLCNAIESKVRIKNLAVKLSADGTNYVSGRIQKTWPIELNPGEELNLEILPESALAGNSPIAVIFDFDNVEIIPDLEKISTSIMLGQKPELTRKIGVSTFNALFGESIKKISVEFEHGSSIVLSPDKLKGEALVRVSLTERMSYKDTADQVRYRVIAERSNGVFPGEWQTSTSDDVTISTDALPKVG